MPIGIDMNNYDISMGTGQIQMSGGGGGLAGNVYINGNVGIGVINPTAILDVNGLIQGSITGGASSFAQIIRNTTGEGAGWNSRLSIVPYLSTGGYSNLSSLGDVGIIWGAITGTNGSLVIAPHSAIGGGLKITSTGNVGIGAITPTTTLHVYGTPGTAALDRPSTGVANTITGKIQFNNGGAEMASISSGLNVGGTGNNGDLRFHTRLDFNTYIERMRIDRAGLVGIGTTSPVTALDVSGQIKTSGGVVFGSAGEFEIEKSATSKTLLISHFSNPNTPICFYNKFPGGTTLVGIDTTSPAYTLDVNGSFRTTGTTELAKVSAQHYIEVGANIGLNLSLIDFHANSGFATDYDARIEVSAASLNTFGTGIMRLYSGGVISDSLITANGGLTMGGAKNITLGSGTVTPTVGQLGYIYSGTYSGTASFTNATNNVYSTLTSVPAGTYMLFATMFYTPTTAVIERIRGAFQATGSGVIGDSIIYGSTVATSNQGCVNISTCFTSTTAKTYDVLIILYFSSGAVAASSTNFVFKMVKIA